jgi:inner membrane protein
MDPLTHIVVSITASRAGLSKLTRLATPMLIVSGLAADLDWLTALAGPRAFLIGHRTAAHSLIGTAAIALVIAIAFVTATRNHPTAPVRFFPALGVSFIGAALALLFDLTNSYGVKLLWPFSERWFALDILSTFDLWILFLLLAGILLPMLFRLVSDEIGAKQKPKSAAVSAALAMALVLVYVGGRYVLHMRALDLLNSRLYQGETPFAVGAFPDSPSPAHWAGVVVAENALFRVDVPVAFGNFDPFSAKPFYKPAPSAALDAARATGTASLFLSFARFPRATVEQNDRGYHIEITDMRFEIGSPQGKSMAAIIDLNPQAHVIHEELQFGDLFQR